MAFGSGSGGELASDDDREPMLAASRSGSFAATAVSSLSAGASQRARHSFSGAGVSEAAYDSASPRTPSEPDDTTLNVNNSGNLDASPSACESSSPSALARQQKELIIGTLSQIDTICAQLVDDPRLDGLDRVAPNDYDEPMQLDNDDHHSERRLRDVLAHASTIGRRSPVCRRARARARVREMKRAEFAA